jgi:uncharacterized protein
VLRGAVKQRVLTREEVIIVSKIGYVQGQNLKQAESREQAGHPYPEMVKYGEGIWHCIHPEFLADQLAASLDRLGIATLDVCLLHNPEYFLAHAAKSGRTGLAEIRDQFYRRIENAFFYLETQVAAGRINWYGVSSNTVAGAGSADDAESTSLDRLLFSATRAAASCGMPKHHFAVLQYPMNLFEHYAWSRPNTGPHESRTVLQLAQQEQLAVLVNRPLNAMPSSGGGVLRLAEVPVDTEAVNLEEVFRAVAGLEDEYRRTLASAIPYSGKGMAPRDFFNWAAELAPVRAGLQGLEHWEQIEHQMIAPQVNQVLQAIPRLLGEVAAKQWEAWKDRYVPPLLTLLRGLRHEAAEKSRSRLAKVDTSIERLLPEGKQKQSMSRKALWVLTSTPGVTCVLNGMRTVRYVEDSIAIMGWDPLNEPGVVYNTIEKIPVL